MLTGAVSLWMDEVEDEVSYDVESLQQWITSMCVSLCVVTTAETPGLQSQNGAFC